MARSWKNPDIWIVAGLAMAAMVVRCGPDLVRSARALALRSVAFSAGETPRPSMHAGSARSVGTVPYRADCRSRVVVFVPCRSRQVQTSCR